MIIYTNNNKQEYNRDNKTNNQKKDIKNRMTQFKWISK